MITSWQLYWILELDEIGKFLGCTYTLLIIGIVILSILNVIATITNDDCEDTLEKIKLFRKWWKYAVVMFFINSLGWFLPSTKNMAVIIVAPKIINNQKVQQIPDKVLDLANSWLDELKPKDKKCPPPQEDG
jgi:hypothetical protein